jgi:hypothetical protein
MTPRTDFTVRVTLTVKADDADEAANIVAERLIKWYSEDDNKQPPYPKGALLLFSIER